MTLDDLPDLPRWVEAHGLAADPTSWRRPGAVGNARARLIVAYSADASALAAELPDHTVLSPTPPGVRAILHTLPDPDLLPDLDGAAPLPADADLAHVPAPLRAELASASAVWSAYVDGVPSAFAYVLWRSPRWFDVAVEVLPGARQLGLGTLVAAALIRDERAHGREPVWGADEGNLGSLRLAARLGFAPADELYVLPPR